MGLFSGLFGGSKEPKKVELPTTLAELTKLREKKPNLADDCDREIMKLIQKAYDEDALVFDSSSQYNYTSVLRRLQFLLEKSFAIKYEHPEKEQCYLLYLDVMTRALNLAEKDPSLEVHYDGEFGADSWYHCADYLTDGKYVPRDVRRATLLTRQHIMYTMRMQQSIWWMDIERMLEIPAEGEISKDLFMKMNALMYGLDGVKVREGIIRENYRALEMAQLAEYLYQMDYEQLRSNDHSVVISALNKAVADGNPFAKYLLGKYYIKGIHVDPDFEKGAALVDEAVQAGLSRPADYLHGAYDEKRTSVDDKDKRQRNALEKKSKEYSAIHDRLRKTLSSYVAVISEYMSSAETVSTWTSETYGSTSEYTSASSYDAGTSATDDERDEPSPEKVAVSGFPYSMTDSYGVSWSLLNDMGYAAEYVSAGGTHRTVTEEDLNEGHWHY